MLDGSGDAGDELVLLADFIEAASARYTFTKTPIAIGFSNGAIMAATLLLTRAGLLAGACARDACGQIGTFPPVPLAHFRQ